MLKGDFITDLVGCVICDIVIWYFFHLYLEWVCCFSNLGSVHFLDSRNSKTTGVENQMYFKTFNSESLTLNSDVVESLWSFLFSDILFCNHAFLFSLLLLCHQTAFFHLSTHFLAFSLNF